MTPSDPTVPTDVQVAPVDPGLQPSATPVADPVREALVKKYEAQFGAPPAGTPVEPVAVEPVVVAEPATSVVDPLAALTAEIAALKAQLTPKPVEPVATPVTEEDWLKLLADGKKSEGELALARVLGPQIQQQAVQQALQLMQAEREVTDFSTKVKAANPDILPMEAYVAQAAQARIEAAKASGLIKSPADYVTVYKQAVTAEIENARKLVQTLRGAGKQEAITRNAEVVSSQTVKPNAVNLERDAPAKPGEPPVEDAAAYLAKRNALHARNSGLSTTA